MITFQAPCRKNNTSTQSQMLPNFWPNLYMHECKQDEIILKLTYQLSTVVIVR